MLHRTFRGLVVLGLAAIATAVSGCQDPIFSGVSLNISPNLETVTVTLDFVQSFQSDLGGTFDVSNNGVDYGQVIVQPTTSATPFNVGFRFNTAILNDPDYNNLINIDPTTTMPGGEPLPIPNLNRALVALSLKNPVSQDFNPYVYLDVSGQQWIGVALSLMILDNKYLPSGLAVQGGFLPDSNKVDRAWAAVYGPAVDSAGNISQAGGIAIFANIPALIAAVKAGQIPPVAKFNAGPMHIFYY